MTTGHLFVYGTLKINGQRARYFDKVRLGSISATVKGIMYNIDGHFPAVVLNENGKVHGELHKYSDFENVIEICDKIEAEGYLYSRTETEVEAETGIKITAIIYVINQKIVNLEEMEIIEDGIWKE